LKEKLENGCERHQVYSPTFYKQPFHTKVWWTAFFYLSICVWIGNFVTFYIQNKSKCLNEIEIINVQELLNAFFLSIFYIDAYVFVYIMFLQAGRSSLRLKRVIVDQNRWWPTTYCNRKSCFYNVGEIDSSLNLSSSCPPEARTEDELSEYDNVSWWIECFLQVTFFISESWIRHH